MRKAIAYAPVYLHISQSQDNDNTKFRIDQKTTANIPAVNEEWITDWESRETKDPVMGMVKAKARWSEAGSVDDSDFLAGGWLDEGKEQVEAFVEGVGAGWTAHQVSFRHEIAYLLIKSGSQYSDMGLRGAPAKAYVRPPNSSQKR